MVGTHYRVGKKIGEGSFGVVFEGVYPPALFRIRSTPLHSYQPSLICFFFPGVNILTNTPVAIKFVRFQYHWIPDWRLLIPVD